MSKKYTVSDGKLVLFLEPAEGGWYAITSPLDPGLITQAKSIEEAFVMAYDAQKCLKAARAKLARELGMATPTRDQPPGGTARAGAARRSKKATPKALAKAKPNAPDHP